MASVGRFFFGLLIGYAVALFGWIGYADALGIDDAGGLKLLSVAVLFAPAAGMVLGVVLVATGWRRP